MGTYNRNMETGKLEMHFDKSEYLALSNDQKKEIKSNFLFSRYSGAWISRCKFPNLHYAEQVAIKLGLEKTDATGEKLTFAEQMEVKAERAERRADRYDYKSDKAESKGTALQKPINDMHGDIAFFTQPNINTSAGRAFTRQRNRMWDSYEKGMEEFRKSEYYARRAEKARETAAKTKTHDKGFCQRRIDDANKTIRAQKRNIESYNNTLAKLEAGEAVKKFGGDPYTIDEVKEWIDHAEEIIEDAISKVAYYDALIHEAGGVIFSKDNIKVGYIVKLSKHWMGDVEVVGTGSKNITYRTDDGFRLKASYAEIVEVVRATEDVSTVELPFNVGDVYTVQQYNYNTYRYEPKEYTVTKVNGYKVSVKSGSERAKCVTARKGMGASANMWILDITHGSHGSIYKPIKES